MTLDSMGNVINDDVMGNSLNIGNGATSYKNLVSNNMNSTGSNNTLFNFSGLNQTNNTGNGVTSVAFKDGEYTAPKENLDTTQSGFLTPLADSLGMGKDGGIGGLTAGQMGTFGAGFGLAGSILSGIDSRATNKAARGYYKNAMGIANAQESRASDMYNTYKANQGKQSAAYFG